LTALALLAFARWISDDDASRFYVLHRNCSCTNNCSLANCDTWAYERIRTNPRVGANHNRRTQQRKIRLGMIVCSRAEMGAMRDRDARTECHATEIIHERLLADCALISSLKIPRKIDCRRWIYMHASTNLCAEPPKQKSSPTKTRPGTESEKRQRQRPQHSADHIARCVLPSAAIFFNIQHSLSRVQRGPMTVAITKASKNRIL